MECEESQRYAMQLVTASVLPMVLKGAIELGVFEIMSKAGSASLLSPSQIVSQLLACINPDAPAMLDRILRLLASHSIVSCSNQVDDDGMVKRVYGLSPVSYYFIPNQDGASLVSFLDLVQDKVMVNMWYHLKDSVLEGGRPFDRAHGMDASQYIGNDDRVGELFKGGTKNYNMLFMKKVFGEYNGFEDVKTLVDVGGGDGSILNMIVSKYPTTKGINLDLAQVIDKAPSYPGVLNVAGDMLLSIPKGDAIFMKWILHLWDDDKCLKILRNCHEALPENGKVMAVDLVVAQVVEESVGMRGLFQLESFRMGMRPGGKERTESEYENLGKAAGFSTIKVACSHYSFSLIEFHKNI